jgi:hypothetical protein
MTLVKMLIFFFIRWLGRAQLPFNVAEDAYHKRLEMEAIISFLGALRGLGEICLILVESTVNKLGDLSLEDRIANRIVPESSIRK